MPATTAMTNPMLSLRVLIVSASMPLRDSMQEAAASLPVPVEAVGAPDAATAAPALARGIDIVFADSALGAAECASIARLARSRGKSPFVVVLADAQAEHVPDADGVSIRPSGNDDAKRLVHRAARLRLPSRVLVVDDSRTMRSIVRKILEATRFPFVISEAGEGLAALKLIREVDFDLIFLDYNMPEFSGIETLAEIRREMRQVSVVMMSTSTDEELAEKALARGAAAFLKKPFFPSDMDAVLCRFYGLRALNPKRA